MTSDRRTAGRLAALGRDLRYAARRLAQRPGFTLTAVVSLALAIGANTALFSLVDEVLLRKPPLAHPEQLVDIYISGSDTPYNVFSWPDFRDMREATREVFSGVTASRLVLTQADSASGVETLIGEAVSGSYFPVLGIRARVGRTLLPEDDLTPGAHPVVVLGHGYWQRAFGGDPGVVGREMRLAGRAFQIVGVAPEEYGGAFRGIEPDLYAPMMMINQLQPSTVDDLEARANHSSFVKGRLRPGVGLPEAQATLDALATRLREQQPGYWDPGDGFTLLRTTDVLLYPPLDRFVRAAAWLLGGVVGLVLLIACVNLASFLLARGLDRRKEIAVRLALGASRGGLVRQLLTETLLLGLLGGGAGVLLAAGLLHLLRVADLPLPIPVTLDLAIDGRVLGFNLAISLLAGVAFGLFPALQSSRADVAGALKDDSAGGGQRGRLRLRGALVVTQVAVSLVLLVGAALFLRSLQSIQTVDPGFGRSPTALLTFALPTTRFDESAGRAFLDRMLERFERIPGVETVGVTSNLPLNTLNRTMIGIRVDGVEPPPGRESHLVDRSAVDPGYFDAMGIEIVSGRGFTDADGPDSRPVVVVSQAFARRFFPDREAVGQLLRQPDAEDLHVVGVARDVKVRSLGEAPLPFVYRALAQEYTTFPTVVARTATSAEATARELLRAGRELDPDLWVWEATTMDRHLGIMLLPARLSALLLACFAGLALLLAAIGLYGIVSYAVAQRRREVGIRMSLGADGTAVVRLLTGSGLRLVALGCALGLGASLLLARALGGLLFGVAAWDPVAFAAGPGLLLAIAAVAAWLPARRASRVDPVSALRAE